MRLYLGIDPGVSGAWVVINKDCKIEKLGLWADRLSFLNSVCTVCGINLAVIEKVHSMPRQGVVSTFTFGTNYGWWLGALDTLKIPYEKATPMKWQKRVLDVAPPKGDKKAIKESIVAFARRRFPAILPEMLTVKKNWGLADAACLALYARLMDDPSYLSKTTLEQ